MIRSQSPPSPTVASLPGTGANFRRFISNLSSAFLSLSVFLSTNSRFDGGFSSTSPFFCGERWTFYKGVFPNKPGQQCDWAEFCPPPSQGCLSGIFHRPTSFLLHRGPFDPPTTNATKNITGLVFYDVLLLWGTFISAQDFSVLDKGIGVPHHTPNYYPHTTVYRRIFFSTF